MTPTKILITGATGFIGSRFCERLTLHYKLPFRAFVRNFTRANRIARMDAEMMGGNLRDPASIEKALAGCDTIVHLAHSDDEFAAVETRNLVTAARKASIKRFVHMSSMAVHGPHPGPECAREETATIGRYGSSYSDAKAAAEEVVQSAIKEFFPAVILRPTIVYGPYSPFVLNAVDRARRGEISLIDDGRGICNAVYVDDVCDALHHAATEDNIVGKAMFINADAAVSWGEFNRTFGEMVTPQAVERNFSSAELGRVIESRRPNWKSNITALGRLPLSRELHRQLATVPVLDKTLRWTKGTLKGMLSEEQVFALKSRMRGQSPGKAGGQKPSAMPDEGRLRRETFPLQFSNELAKRTLKWAPAYDLKRGAAVTRTWLEFARMLTAI